MTKGKDGGKGRGKVASLKSLWILTQPFAARVLQSYRPVVQSILCQIVIVLWFSLTVIPGMSPSSIQQLENYSTLEFLAVKFITPASTPVYQASVQRSSCCYSLANVRPGSDDQISWAVPLVHNVESRNMQ